MKKRLIGTLLLGALMVSSTSVFVSCKDYDDDINNIVATKADKTLLEETRLALQTEIGGLRTRLEGVEGQIASLNTKVTELSNGKADKFTENGKTYNLQDVWNALNPLLQKEQELRTRLTAAESAITDINNLIGGQLSNGKTYKEAVEDLYAKLAAIDTKLTTAISRIDGIEADLNTPTTGLKAVVADLTNQVNVLNGYKARVEAIEADYLKAADKTELLNKIDALKTQLQGEITAAETAAKSYAYAQAQDALRAAKDYTDGEVQKLTQKLNALSDQVNALGAALNTLNVYVKNALRGLVFIPESYNWGIEAMGIHAMNYFYYRYLPDYPNNIPAAKADEKEKVGYVGADHATAAVNYAVPGKRTLHARYDSVEQSRVLKFVAKYHMNPSSANIADAKKIEIIDQDRMYVTRGHSEAFLSCDPDITKHSWENGVLSVNVKVADLTKIKSIRNQGLATTFATQITIDNGDQDTTITSDYATVYQDTIRDLRLAHANLPKWSTAYAAERGYNNGYIFNAHCGGCSKDDAATPNRRSHLMATVAEAAYFASQDSVDWNKTLDLNALMETHYTTEAGQHDILKAEEMAANGLSYKFELTGYYIGTNATSESAQAAIKDGILRPQMPTTDGKGAAYEATAQDRSTIGRTPMVRVSLVMTDDAGVERTLDYGYIRIKITETKTAQPDPATPVLTYTGATYTYTYSGECVDPAGSPEPYEVSTTWVQTQYDIYNKLMNDPNVNLGSISREEFEDIYKLNATDAGAMPVPYTAGNPSDLKQYEVKADGTVGEALATKIGTASVEIDVNPENGQATHTLKWTMDAATAKAFFVDGAGTLDAKAKEHTAYGIAVKYVSNQAKYPDFYVVLQAPGKATVTVNKPKAVVNWDNYKITEYWYNTNGTAGGSGKDEIHAQTITPEDVTAATVCVPLDTRISDVFNGNTLLTSAMYTITDNTAGGEYALDKLTMSLIFDKKNDDKEYKGVSGITYKMRVDPTNDKNLQAADKSKDPLVYVTIAKIVLDGTGLTGINHQVVELQHGVAEAEDLLNYKAHNELAEDVLFAYIGMKAQNACPKDLPLEYTPFATRFLRPINAKGADVDPIEDANPKQLQVINLRDLVTLTDWRDEPFKTTPKDYWAYYNIKKIEIDGAAADGSDISQYIKTNLNQADGSFVKLSTVTNQIELTYAPIGKTTGAFGTAESYGTLTYRNNSNALGQFDLRFKVRVTYEWGYVLTQDITVHVNSTRNNARQK